MKRLFVCLLVSVGLSGCAHYITPGEKADLRGMASAAIENGFEAKPTDPFPAAIVAVRVQGPHYSSYGIDRVGGRYGSGRYSVITVREVEEAAGLERITRLPEVSGLISINRLLLPERLESDEDLRIAAARLHADLLLIYTFDTAFFYTDSAKPLTVITLGLSPTRKIRATTTVSALLIDTRTGYIYSAYEATESQGTRSTSWGSRDSADEVRKDTEKKAFTKLVGDVVKSWPQLLKQYDPKYRLSASGPL